MKRNILWTMIAGIALMSSAVFAQPAQTPEPLLFQNFDQNAAEWTAFGGGTVSVTQDAENIKAGTGALRFDYSVAAGQINALASPVAAGALTNLQSISFWIKSDHNASFLLAVQERGGGRFAATFSAPQNQWQQVEIGVDDFLLQNGSGDPKDANGKLDVDKIEYAGLIDFDQVLLQLIGNEGNPAAQLVRIDDGPRTLFLDELSFSSKPLPKTAAPADGVVLDPLEHPQAGWVGVGDVALQRVAGKDATANALKADYQQAPGQLSGLIKPLAPGILAGKKVLSFKAVSTQHANLLLLLEETGGGRYNVPLEVSAGGAPVELSVNFSAMKPAQDSRDDNNQLDLEKVKQILIVDISGLAGGGGGENTLWLGDIRAR